MEKSKLLNNQSNEMATLVETFVIEETAELIYDGEKLDEWNRLVNELGLTGQTAIVQKEKSPIPFMHLKKDMVNVFETLCPRKVDVKAYNVTPIPVEILSLVSLSNNEGYFDKIQIWYDDKTPDPICVGMAYTDPSDRAKGYTWLMETYLLGKWADVKRSFAELTEMAVKRWVVTEKNRLAKLLVETQRSLDDIEINAFEKFGSKETNSANDDLPF